METAIEQLIEKMSLSDVYRYSNELSEAKEMFENQIKYAWNSASGGDAFHNSEQYYNETFKSE